MQRRTFAMKESQDVFFDALRAYNRIIYRVSHIIYSETLNKEYIERIHQMSYSSLSDNGMLQIFSFVIK